MTAFSTLYSELQSRLQDTTNAVWTLARRKEFINAAIRHANDMGAYRIVVDDESLTVISGATEYILPAGVPFHDALFRVSVEGSAGSYIPKHSWTTTETRTYVGGEETKTLKLILQQQFPEVGRKIRLEYLAPHQPLTADTDETSLPREYILAYAMFLANEETRTSADVDRKYHLEAAQRYFQIADVKLSRILAGLPRVDGRTVVKVW